MKMETYTVSSKASKDCSGGDVRTDIAMRNHDSLEVR